MAVPIAPSTFSVAGASWPRVALAALFGVFLACSAPDERSGESIAALGDSSLSSGAKESSTGSSRNPTPAGMVMVPGGMLLMGDPRGFAHESPVHEVRIDSFYLDIDEVTNDQFTKFAQATGYKTEAELWGWSFAFRPDRRDPERVVEAEWWAKVEGADWRHPAGPESSIDGQGNLPVVQVSWHDAAAYAKWAGKRLPTEAEYEYAARGGLVQATYPWGEGFDPLEKPMANTWDGTFPLQDAGLDGFRELAPAGSFPPNAYGLRDMAGNVWEWCSDWYHPEYYQVSEVRNPGGPSEGTEKIMRGGSWLCAPNYCVGYRVAHRNKATPDSAWDHTGFRCALALAE